MPYQHFELALASSTPPRALDVTVLSRFFQFINGVYRLASRAMFAFL